MLNSDTLVFAGILFVTASFLVQRRRHSTLDRSRRLVGAGLLVLCLASGLDTAILDERPWFDLGIDPAAAEIPVVLFGYIPGLVLVGAGLAKWMPAVAQLEEEMRRRREAEEEARRQAVELMEAKLRAETADAAKGRFLAHMSHELRTPLNAILGFSEMLALQPHGPLGDPRYLGYADDIHRSGRHLLRVINEVLDLSKIEAGLETLQEEEFPLEAVAADCERLLQQEFCRLGLCLQVDRVSLRQRLRFDRTKLTRILINLLGNALKFTPGGGHVRLHAVRLPDGGLRLVVEDDGVGMTPQEVEVALTAFGQADNAVRREGQGSGLGLPIVRSLMELHGGGMAIESRKGRGTRVLLDLPPERLLPEQLLPERPMPERLPPCPA